MYFEKGDIRGGTNCPPITSLLRRTLELSISNQMIPLRSYDHPFHKNLVFFRERLSDLSTIFNKMGISKFYGIHLGKRGHWERIVALRSLLTLNTGTKTFKFSIKRAPSKVYTTTPSKKTYTSEGITFNMCPQALEGLCRP